MTDHAGKRYLLARADENTVAAWCVFTVCAIVFTAMLLSPLWL